MTCNDTYKGPPKRMTVGQSHHPFQNPGYVGRTWAAAVAHPCGMFPSWHVHTGGIAVCSFLWKWVTLFTFNQCIPHSSSVAEGSGPPAPCPAGPLAREEGRQNPWEPSLGGRTGQRGLHCTKARCLLHQGHPALWWGTRHVCSSDR